MPSYTRLIGFDDRRPDPTPSARRPRPLSDPVADKPDHAFETTHHGIAVRRGGAGEPLVLLHGGAGSWAHWMPVLRRLGAGFTTLAFDLPGYGDSAAPPDGISDDGYLDLVADAIDALVGADPVHIAAFSFGATIAAEMAARRPVQALSMTGAAGFGKPEGRGFTLDSRRKMTARLGRPPNDAEFREMQADNLAKLMIHDRDKVTDWAIAMQADNVARTRFDSRRISWADRTVPALARTTCPVMMVYGVHDTAAVPSVGDRFARVRAVRPDVEAVTIDDCGHWAMFEAPETTAHHLLRFHGANSV